MEGDRWIAVPVSTSPSLTVGSPGALFSTGSLAWAGTNYLGYDVNPEDNKFVS